MRLLYYTIAQAGLQGKMLRFRPGNCSAAMREGHGMRHAAYPFVHEKSIARASRQPDDARDALYPHLHGGRA